MVVPSMLALFLLIQDQNKGRRRKKEKMFLRLDVQALLVYYLSIKHCLVLSSRPHHSNLWTLDICLGCIE
jgi:hypothetical protein